MIQKIPKKIQYSKIKINRVITPKQWKKSLYNQKAFTREFKPQAYDYWDYQKAWFNIMLLRPYTHSWFIWFKRGQAEFPYWFSEWFFFIWTNNNFFFHLLLRKPMNCSKAKLILLKEQDFYISSK